MQNDVYYYETEVAATQTQTSVTDSQLTCHHPLHQDRPNLEPYFLQLQS